jgi:hypothetical protein
MPLEYDTFIAGANTPASTINAALRDHKCVRVTGDQSWTSGIVLPEGSVLRFDAPHFVFRGFAGGPLITQLSFASIVGFPRFQANGYDGTCIYVPSGSNFIKMNGDPQITEWIGVCIDMSEPTAGHECDIEDLLAQRTNPALPAIVLPQDETTTRGLRRFEDCQSASRTLIDVGGSNLTNLQNCTMFGFKMNDACDNLKARDCRFAYHPGEIMEIRGANHCFRDNHVSAVVNIYGQGHVVDQYDAGRHLMPGSSQCRVTRYPTAAFTVNQGVGNVVVN